MYLKAAPCDLGRRLQSRIQTATLATIQEWTTTYGGRACSVAKELRSAETARCGDGKQCFASGGQLCSAKGRQCDECGAV